MAKDNQDESTDELLALAYDDLRMVAARFFADESPGHTLQPTAIVHEAYLRIADQSKDRWESKSHFVAVAAKMMRRLLVDHGRKKMASKRGGGKNRVTFCPTSQDGGGGFEADILVVHEALKELHEVNSRFSEIVELRFFGGLTIPEVAKLLNLSEATVQNDWAQARSWLSFFLEESGRE